MSLISTRDQINQILWLVGDLKENIKSQQHFRKFDILQNRTSKKNKHFHEHTNTHNTLTDHNNNIHILVLFNVIALLCGIKTDRIQKGWTVHV